ncbi:hypothetical protein B9Z65_1274 [Elsinoe australis]|uniref:F-box domain-containing protein n=1 Tax=Elsinoe australis TaxID=40998 RepID=A0A2P7YQ35_9PEZI|nr:hypothetical protein B9Z65_1274 [Elsinoe australis]
MSRLLDCSHEVLHNILTQVEPADLASLAISCRSLNTFIDGNVLLHKELYLQRWDAPLTPTEQDYPTALHSLVLLQKTFTSPSLTTKQTSLSTSGRTILSLLSVPSERNTAFVTSNFTSQPNIDALLTRSTLYVHAGTSSQTPADSPSERQLSAKLHVHFGIPVDHASPSCPYRYATNRPGYGSVRSPYHILYPRSHGNAFQSQGVEEDEDGKGHYLRSSVAVRVPANNVARAKVYDLREYTTKSLWGPFKEDGSHEVDWEKMEAVMVLLGYNLRMFAERTRGVGGLWYGPWEGVAAGSFREPDWGKGEAGVDGISRLAARGEVLGLSGEGHGEEWRNEEEREVEMRQRELDEKDPFGISGTWMRVVCFLDYNDLYAFNFTRPRGVEDDKGIDTREAIRLIKLKLKVTRVVFPSGDAEDSDSSSDYAGDLDVEARYREGPASPSSPMGNKKDTPMRGQTKTRNHPYSHWPVVYFTGTSRSLHASWDPNANSRIRGVVRMTKHGDVRWTTWSIFHGEERWRSEGIQVGGPKSGRGVLGNWFDKDFEAQGPAGPTAFWKVSNHIIEDKEEDPTAHHHLPFLWPLDDDSDGDDDEDFDDDRNPPRDGSSEEREDFESRRDEEDDDQEGVGEAGYGDVEIIDEELEGVECVVEDTRDDVIEDGEGEGA